MSIFVPMLSMWEQRSFQAYDVIIVGAGITGLSTAAALVEQRPQLKVLVLERGSLPTGASTRNVGFACFGSLTELLVDVDTMGWDRMLQLVERRWRGLQKTIERLGADAIDLQTKGGWELLYQPANRYLEEMREVNDRLHSIFSQDVFTDCTEDLPRHGFSGFQGLLYNQLEGQLDTGKLVSSLWRYCAERGVSVLTGTPVTRFEPDADHVHVETPSMTFRGRQVVLCTNAFTNSLRPVDLRPGRGTVVVVEPESPLAFEGTFHYEEGYFYFRDFYGKLVFGGARNEAIETETTTDFGINPDIINRLREDLEQKIIPGQRYDITHQWSGIMAFGANKQPIVERLHDRVCLGVRLGGMGVAIGSLVGQELASLVIPSVQ